MKDKMMDDAKYLENALAWDVTKVFPEDTIVCENIVTVCDEENNKDYKNL